VVASAAPQLYPHRAAPYDVHQPSVNRKTPAGVGRLFVTALAAQSPRRRAQQAAWLLGVMANPRADEHQPVQCGLDKLALCELGRTISLSPSISADRISASGIAAGSPFADELGKAIDRRQSMPLRQRHNQAALGIGERIGADDQPASRFSGKHCDCGLDLCRIEHRSFRKFGAGRGRPELKTQFHIVPDGVMRHLENSESL
jgi:hypothetical protein